MRFSLRRRSLAAIAMLGGISLSTFAQTPRPAGYPDRPVTIVVPFAAGGATDIIGRLVADELGKRWSATVLVENRAGAGGAIGTEQVARAKPDGYTLLLGTQTALAVSPTLVAKLPYNVQADFTPISLLASTPLVLLASSASGAQSAQDLIRMIKAKPGTLSYGTSGNGTSQHLTAEMFLNGIGSTALHVPYKGSSASLTDLAGGQIDMQFDNMATALSFAKTGKARALAVTSAKRSELAPDLPTLAEAGLPGFETATWLGLLGPARMPPALLQFLNEEVVAVLNSAEVRAKLAAQGFTPKPMTSAAFTNYIAEETAKFAALIKLNRITLEGK